MSADTRLHPRAPLRRPVRVKLGSATLEGETLEVGEGGLSMTLRVSSDDEGIEVGSEANVSFMLADDGYSVAATGTIAWVWQREGEEGGVAVGLQFESGQRNTKTQLRGYVRAFRYAVGFIHLQQDDPILNKLKGAFQLRPLTQQDVKQGKLENVGLVLVGDSGVESDVHDTVASVEARGREGRFPLALFGGQLDAPSLNELLRACKRVLALSWDAVGDGALALVDRLVEAHMYAIENERLTIELQGTLERLRRENQYFREKILPASRLDGVVGESPPMVRVYEAVERVAPHDTSVLIGGETGTGKDLIARAIHQLSNRGDKKFMAQNCAALTETLADSELFGHVRGSFTGADQHHTGLFEAANGGTIFLDEVGEMSPAIQAKLLHVLQNGEIRKVGDTKSIHVDVRVLCATNRDLEIQVREGAFREDLYYRLSPFVIHLPPLRERGDDIALLAQHFLTQFTARHGKSLGGFTAKALEAMESYAWPGNVRQLQHVVERVAILVAPDTPIDVDDVQPILDASPTLPSAPAQSQDIAVDTSVGLEEAVMQYEEARIRDALKRSGGVITQAAKLLQINRTTLSKKCKRLGIGL